jgi:hypothetical protein
MSVAFSIHSGLRQGYALSSLFFNFLIQIFRKAQGRTHNEEDIRKIERNGIERDSSACDNKFP